MRSIVYVCIYVREVDVYSSCLHPHPSLADLVNLLPLSVRVVSGELYAPVLCCAGRQSDHRIIFSLHMYKKSLRRLQEIQRSLVGGIVVERCEVEGCRLRDFLTGRVHAAEGLGETGESGSPP